ncbi:terminal uridylyltransferase 3, putative [Trypanosoma brucei gambiense DAL972]|uniref:RNA uridylyltransferase n=1 Tax=Trypanosoma brucei gambiense (strain MHOM/CI/86/DAL972) TaxID=679716 RepID=D0A3G3_TRYB9|nr:terminal uridylyltransferase 3, putative [Trypanosoma brucei gambiense DAL972]CBH15807.1 terminal uridylyltransferase 3, putative [Trypanosoma brucei gambiense DAL972]|eukprot:XP_011778071.1 terminal uridylyltransferase 3, putative [Trypanosoma brucei gambiense DAL972]
MFTSVPVAPTVVSGVVYSSGVHEEWKEAEQKLLDGCLVHSEGDGATKQIKEKLTSRNSQSVRCDLCAKMIESRDEEQIQEHFQVHHAALSLWCREILASKDNLLHYGCIPSGHIVSCGNFVLESAAALDMGRKTFDVIERAFSQMSQVISCFVRNLVLFPFGSCVSCGCWDGVSDADFTAIGLQDMKKGKWPPEDEKKVILRLTAALRKAGFFFGELEPLVRTRVPVVRRVQKVRVPLRSHGEDDTYSVVWSNSKEFSSPPRMLVEAAISSTVERKDSDTLTFHFKDSLKAVKFFCNSAMCGPRDMEVSWKTGSQLPEMFSLDFDLSCRAQGVRNSLFLRKYFQQDPFVRTGYLFLKKWSKLYGINNAKNGYLTSYAVSILWVHFLLENGLVKFVRPADVEPIPDLSQQKMSYLPLLRDDGDGGERPSDVLKSPELTMLRGALGGLIPLFFLYYTRIRWDKVVVTLRVPGGGPPVTPDSLGWVEANEVKCGPLRDRVWYRLCIDDPYEDNFNLGRHLSPDKASFVKVQFMRALASIVAGRPQQLLVDEQKFAEETMPAYVTRLSVQGELRNLRPVTVSALRQLLIDSAGADCVAIYEASHNWETLLDMASTLNNKSKEGDDDAEGVTNNQEGEPPDHVESCEAPRRHLLCSKMHSIDDALLVAGPLGVSDANIPAGLLGVYFLARGRAFRTAEDRDNFLMHAEAVSAARARGCTTREEILERVADAIPSIVRNGTLLDDLLVSGSEENITVQSPVVVETRCAETVQRKKSKGSKKRKNAVRRGNHAGQGTCSECGASGTDLWEASDKSADDGLYCGACWKAYDCQKN